MSSTLGEAAIMAAILVLPVSALVARRVPVATLAKLGAIWVALAGVIWLTVANFT